MLAGVFRSSISLVVIMLEGTGHVGYLVPLLVGVAVANLTGNFINGDSFYEKQLRAKGVPFLHHHDAIAPCTAVSESEGRMENVRLNTAGCSYIQAQANAHPPIHSTRAAASIETYHHRQMCISVVFRNSFKPLILLCQKHKK